MQVQAGSDSSNWPDQSGPGHRDEETPQRKIRLQLSMESREDSRRNTTVYDFHEDGKQECSLSSGHEWSALADDFELSCSASLCCSTPRWVLMLN